jgi:hypothetical protein
LNHIFIDDEIVNKIPEIDRKMIEIFNSYKKNKIVTKQIKIKNLFKKRLGKKKFFNIKREDDKNTSINEDAKRNNIKDMSLNLSSVQTKNAKSNIKFSSESYCHRENLVHKNLEEIVNQNKIFFSKFLTFNYDFEKTVLLLKSYLESNHVYLNLLMNVSCNFK